ncbi:ganglioside GM2 activator-like [Patiria miniata]|uniref:MD-2-related lipid-recognition domain-containing protein n=1 Tax=Patiria miniata TaxID=46514 RepID=A0A913ZWB8_PATMI|nr:ganglioside GM2 activator-like [Patiria miniata]
MNFSIYISMLCLIAAALVHEKTSALTIASYARSTDCGGSSATVRGTFSVDPVGSNSVSLSASGIHVDEDLDYPLKAVVEIEKKVLWWWATVPCAYGYGSCTYNDVCEQFVAPSDLWPDCPIPSSTYNVQGVIDIPSTWIPSWLVGGDYRARIKLYKYSRQLGCNDLNFRI